VDVSVGRQITLLALVACSAPAKTPAGPTTAKLGTDEIAYETRGQGPLCVAIPGGPGLDSRYLRDAELEKLFRVVYVDLVGTGRSSRLPPDQQYSIARDAATIEALRVHLKQDKLCLIGHSYGGFVAQQFAVDHPDRVSRLVLYSTTPASTPDWLENVLANLQWFEDRPWFADAMKGFEQDDKATTQAELDAVLQLVMPVYFANYDADPVRLRAAVNRSGFVYEVYKRRPKLAYDVRPRLSKITAPTLVITGNRDFSGGVVPSTWIAERIPGAKLVVLDDVGHFAHLEKPAEFIAALRAFVN
jgi:proline iminopeptidase